MELFQPVPTVEHDYNESVKLGVYVTSGWEKSYS